MGSLGCGSWQQGLYAPRVATNTDVYVHTCMCSSVCWLLAFSQLQSFIHLASPAQCHLRLSVILYLFICLYFFPQFLLGSDFSEGKAKSSYFVSIYNESPPTCQHPVTFKTRGCLSERCVLRWLFRGEQSHDLTT